MKPSSRIGARRVGRRSTRPRDAEDAARGGPGSRDGGSGPGVTFWVKLPAGAAVGRVGGAQLFATQFR